MSTLVAEVQQREFFATEKWPADATFFQPYQAEQVTLPDYSNCLAVRTFLNMCGLKYDLQLRTNAEEMSPSGKVPFMQLGSLLIADFDGIVANVNVRGFSLSSDLKEGEKSELAAYITLVQTVLYNAELYIAWLTKDVFSLSTRPRYGSVFPWPLNWVLPWKKKLEIRSKLEANGWLNKTVENVHEEIQACFQALSDRLGNNKYFFGDKPTELDALVFGHLFNLITFEIPDKTLTAILKQKQFKNLKDLCSRIEAKYYKEIE